LERSKIDELRDFLRMHLGDDWELRLILANAIAGPGALYDDVEAAQQRAVALVRENSPGWTDDMAKFVADAWLALWLEP
jgi:hypothetical protein